MTKRHKFNFIMSAVSEIFCVGLVDMFRTGGGKSSHVGNAFATAVLLLQDYTIMPYAEIGVWTGRNGVTIRSISDRAESSDIRDTKAFFACDEHVKAVLKG